jgi:hypothetical protein
MKQILLVIMFFLLTGGLFAQEKLLTHKKAFIDSTMNADGNTRLSDDLTTDTKLPVSTYKCQTKQFVLFYYDKAGICFECAVVHKREDLDTIIADLSNGYTKQEGNVWIRDDNKLKVGILIQKSIVAVKYTSL